jgi:2-aminoadipate transaminase
MNHLKLTLDRESAGPIYKQIVEQVRTMILQGELGSGAALPTVRALARELSVSNLTVFHAYEELKQLRLIDSQPRQGMRVASRLPSAAGAEILSRLPERGPMASYERISQASGIRSMASSVGDPALFYADEFIAEIEALRRESAWNFYYSEREGAPELLQQIAGLLSRDGLGTTESSLIATNGGTRAIGLILEVMTNPGDVVLVQEPGRLWLSELFGIRRLVGIPVRNSDRGLDLDHVRYCIAQYRPKLLLVSPDFGSCTGIAMPLGDRKACLELCREAGVLIVEDGSHSALRYDDPPLASLAALDPESVAYVGSFSYSLCPALRTGFVRVPKRLKLPLLAISEATSVSGPRFLQVALARYIERGKYDAHLKRILPRFRARRTALLGALRSAMPPSVTWTEPAGGLSAWVTLGAASSSDLYGRAVKQGIAFAPGRLFLTADDPERHLRLSFGLLEPEAIQESVKSLGKLMRR